MVKTKGTQFTTSLGFGSEQTDGRFIKIVATATPGTALHTHASSAKFQRVSLWAWNTDSVARVLTVEWAGVTSPDDTIQVNLPVNGAPQLVASLLLAQGKSVAAFAAAANVVICHAEVKDVNA